MLSCSEPNPIWAQRPQNKEGVLALSGMEARKMHSMQYITMHLLLYGPAKFLCHLNPVPDHHQLASQDHFHVKLWLHRNNEDEEDHAGMHFVQPVPKSGEKM